MALIQSHGCISPTPPDREHDSSGIVMTDLEKMGPVPAQMLSLMGLLEKEGPRFCQKMVITVMGGHDKVRGLWRDFPYYLVRLIIMWLSKDHQQDGQSTNSQVISWLRPRLWVSGVSGYGY